MADMQELIARLEAAEAGSRELGRDVLIGLNVVREVEPTLFYGVGNEDTWHFGDAAESDGYWRILPDPTTSLDAALALADRVLPGWYVGVQPWFHTDPDRVMSRAYLIRPDWKLWNPVGDDWCDQHHGRSCATPALAVVAAILRAIQHGYEAEGEVSPNLKAKAQGEGG